jgi:hypothetical protein
MPFAEQPAEAVVKSDRNDRCERPREGWVSHQINLSGLAWGVGRLRDRLRTQGLIQKGRTIDMNILDGTTWRRTKVVTAIWLVTAEASSLFPSSTCFSHPL